MSHPLFWSPRFIPDNQDMLVENMLFFASVLYITIQRMTNRFQTLIKNSRRLDMIVKSAKIFRFIWKNKQIKYYHYVFNNSTELNQYDTRHVQMLIVLFPNSIPQRRVVFQLDSISNKNCFFIKWLNSKVYWIENYIVIQIQYLRKLRVKTKTSFIK